jgi:hypothetical protein
VKRAAAIALAWALAGACACSDPKLAGACQTDADCRAHFKCNPRLHTCGCADDQACQSGQVCAASGYCRVNVGCVGNEDCPPGQVCDTNTHNCVESGQCTSDLQCPLGQICDAYGDTPSYMCKSACRDTYDCPQGSDRQACAAADGTICVCPEGSDPASCPVAKGSLPGPDGGPVLAGCTCQAGLCTDTQFCPWGQFCRPDPKDGQKPRCISATDPDHPYCQECRLSPGADYCGPGANYCLLDTSQNGGADFCGVDCTGGQECPSGYFCDYVIILTQWLCHRVDPKNPASAPNDAECNRPSGIPCQGDGDCAGARCDTTTHQCAGKCIINEGDPSGFCTCASDGECPKDQCDSSRRECALSKKPCDPADPTACNNAGARIFCTNISGTNGCVIGKNCAPANGLSCSDLPR